MNIVEHQLQMQRDGVSDVVLLSGQASPVRIAREAVVIDGKIKEQSETSADEAEEIGEAEEEGPEAESAGAFDDSSEGSEGNDHTLKANDAAWI